MLKAEWFKSKLFLKLSSANLGSGMSFCSCKYEACAYFLYIAVGVFVTFTPLNVNREGNNFSFPRWKAMDSLKRMVSNEKEYLLKKGHCGNLKIVRWIGSDKARELS